ncbi:hypothetical protein [Mesoplasma melaleucae]|uniref:Uncharacterized protein n=1 Tax=Mesoplasma melaleucae TaxID=81459 RepID=A0A2K8NWS6_9MOLU|nr:hypothetical protein [Mesoplasma melaleucae]ATZ17986.1 hypothetical protein EMELA_v1c04380 [Mesoplasma melaleucae]
MIKSLYKIKGKFNELNFEYDEKSNKYLINGDLNGIVDSTFRQYFIIGYILGVFEIDKEVAFAESFYDYALKKEKIYFNKWFLR